MAIEAFAWRDRPALIEKLFPVQKVSAESYKEQMANTGKALTALGSYWKGRKPLALNRACLIACLMPTSTDSSRDLDIFEKILRMDSESMRVRIEQKLPASKKERALDILTLPFSRQVSDAKRPEEVPESHWNNIWPSVNAHLGTDAFTICELVHQMGVARYGRTPRAADIFAGSGQIPFEMARMGCDTWGSDLNPIACLLTWAASEIVGANPSEAKIIQQEQRKVAKKIQSDLDRLGFEDDGRGWRAKVFLYCLEVRCPESGWNVPLIPSLYVSKDYRVIAKLRPSPADKRYDIDIVYNPTDEEFAKAAQGTVQKGFMVHSPDGASEVRVKISTIRGDHKADHGTQNKLRKWENEDIAPRKDDIYQERLYCIQWMKQRDDSKQFDSRFRAVTAEDEKREEAVRAYVEQSLTEWQDLGYIPKMRIEPGDKTDEPIRTRGWTYWHHLFNPRQLLWGAICKRHITERVTPFFLQSLNWNARLSIWNASQIGGGGCVQNVFSNQALNTLYNYGCRGSDYAMPFITKRFIQLPVASKVTVENMAAHEFCASVDISITDPPYGDAVKYEEITEFFISWMENNTYPTLSKWTWDSRRSLAISGEGHSFKSNMIGAYRQLSLNATKGSIHIMMFTHQSGSIWSDIASIIWSSGFQVTAAWYVVTETDSALRQGANVKGTVILVMRKREQEAAAFRDDLGWEIEAAVQEQVESLIGLDRSVRAEHNEGLYTDADLQMAGYAASLKVLTAYSTIDGKDMVAESERPRPAKGKTFVDELIDFAVQTAVQFLVPVGFEKAEWQNLKPIERFYLKMAEMEHQGHATLDNYRNFERAFKVRDADPLMGEGSKANNARLKLSTEFKGAAMSGDAELAGTPLRALLYALFEIQKGVEVDDVLLHLMDNCANYLQVKPTLIKMALYLAEKRETLKPIKNFKPDEEASASRVLAEAMSNQRL